jgi:hypothetical protein
VYLNYLLREREREEMTSYTEDQNMYYSLIFYSTAYAYFSVDRDPKRIKEVHDYVLKVMDSEGYPLDAVVRQTDEAWTIVDRDPDSSRFSFMKEKALNNKIIQARQVEQLEASAVRMKSAMRGVSEELPKFKYTTEMASEEYVLFEFFPWLKSFDGWQKIDRCPHVDVNNIDMMISLFADPNNIDCYDCGRIKVAAQDESPVCDGCGTDDVEQDKWNNKMFGVGPFSFIGYFCKPCDEKYF